MPQHECLLCVKTLTSTRSNTNEFQHQKMYLLAYAPSEDSDQSAHAQSLIRIFTVRISDSKWCSVSSCDQRRLWSDCVDVQADLSFGWAHMLSGTFPHVAAQIDFRKKKMFENRFQLNTSITLTVTAALLEKRNHRIVTCWELSFLSSQPCTCLPLKRYQSSN